MVLQFTRKSLFLGFLRKALSGMMKNEQNSSSDWLQPLSYHFPAAAAYVFLVFV